MSVLGKAEITISDILDGKGIRSTAITYQAGTSGTVTPTGTWSSTVPTVPQGQYLWSRTVITYTDNTTSTTYSVAYIPKNGAAGGDGATGTGVANIIQQYYLSTSKTSQTGGSWVTSMPTWSSGKYLWTRYQITYKNPTSTAYTSPVCDSSWEAVNEINVGGRNILRFTKSFGLSPEINGGMTSGVPIVEQTYKEFSVRGSTSVSTTTAALLYASYKILDIQYGDVFTFSFYAKGTVSHLTVFFYGPTGYVSANPIAASETCVSRNQIYADGNTKFKISSDWERHWVTYKLGGSGSLDVGKIILIRNDGNTVLNGNCYICGLKLEYGNKPTDWTPAPEDVDQNIQDVQDAADKAQGTADNAQNMAESNSNRLNITEATIKVLSDKICSMVTDENGSTVLTQTSTGFEFNLSAIEQNINKAANDLNNLSGTINEVDNAINNLNKVVDDLGKKTAYIVMTTDDNGDPCIELGKENNPFKVRITNTSVDFLEGTSKIAYVNNKSLYIEKAVIKTDLQIGDAKGFVWETRSNGNMGLRKFG